MGTRFSSRAALGAILALLAGTAAAAAPPCAARSGEATLPLVELFTSEGCDSCPPADRWLSATFPPGGSGAGASVLAFHVDYWDRLGWKDRFATPAYAQRQRTAVGTAGGGGFAYTPQVLVQGRDVPPGRRAEVPGRVSAAAGRPARAAVALDATPGAAGALTVRGSASVADRTGARRAALWLAYTDSGHVTEVKAGENRGVRLAHDHVVRAWHGPFPVGADGAATATVTFAPPAERGRAPAIVAVVVDVGSGDVLQTLTLPACGGG